MKRLLLLTMYMMMTGLSIYATGETYVDPVSNLTFKVIADFPLINDYQVEVVAGEDKYKGDIVIPNIVKIEGIDYSVTAVGERTFQNCEELTSVTIPVGVTSIGTSAFSGCSIESLELPEGITTIKDCAFYGCKFTSISMPNTLLTIGASAFQGSGLIDVIIPNSVTSMGMHAFRESSVETITLSSSMKKLNHYTFYYCRSLRSVIIPEGVETIGEKVFYRCDNLQSITIPKSMKLIGDIYGTVPPGTFWECNKLEKVIISDLAAWCNIKFNYGYNPLYYAHHLYLGDHEITDLVIPEGVTSISEYAFYGGSNFTSLTIPETVTSIGYSAFSGCTGLSSLTIPQSVTTIEYGAFESCTGLKEILSWGEATTLDHTFSQCTGLTSITIPNSVEYIEGAFSGCSNITSINIPSSLKSVTVGSFDNTSLKSITVYDNGEKNYDSRQNCNAVIKTETNDLVIACKNTKIVEGVEILSAEFPKTITSIAFPRSLNIINTTFGWGTPLRTIVAKWEDLSELKFSNINRVFGSISSSDIYKKGKLIVPVSTKSLYQQTEPWKNFVDIIEADGTVLGDVDGNYVVDEADLMEVVNYLMAPSSGALDIEAADVKKDGKINVADIVQIIRIIMEKE